jgi:hypothetical protein
MASEDERDATAGIERRDPDEVWREVDARRLRRRLKAAASLVLAATAGTFLAGIGKPDDKKPSHAGAQPHHGGDVDLPAPTRPSAAAPAPTRGTTPAPSTTREQSPTRERASTAPSSARACRSETTCSSEACEKATGAAALIQL